MLFRSNLTLLAAAECRNFLFIAFGLLTWSKFTKFAWPKSKVTNHKSRPNLTPIVLTSQIVRRLVFESSILIHISRDYKVSDMKTTVSDDSDIDLIFLLPLLGHLFFSLKVN